MIGNKELIRVAITGPESTGKSTLCRQLAAYYHTSWVPEYARSYLDRLERPYKREDLVKIAEGQDRQEHEIAQDAIRVLFCDTESTVFKIWSQFKFGEVDPCILELISKKTYDLYLLMDVDLPWQFDPQREHPDKRQFLFDWYERELKERKVNYVIISGKQQMRFKNACQAIDLLL